MAGRRCFSKRSTSGNHRARRSHFRRTRRAFARARIRLDCAHRREPSPRPRQTGGAVMKAAILYKANTPLEVVDVEQQGPQAGEARVRVMATGVCHSDWHVIKGDWALPLPMVLGPEAAGIVGGTGAGGGNGKPGDHVIFS